MLLAADCTCRWAATGAGLRMSKRSGRRNACDGGSACGAAGILPRVLRLNYFVRPAQRYCVDVSMGAGVTTSAGAEISVDAVSFR